MKDLRTLLLEALERYIPPVDDKEFYERIRKHMQEFNRKVVNVQHE